jgi:hypothetical protein
MMLYIKRVFFVDYSSSSSLNGLFNDNSLKKMVFHRAMREVFVYTFISGSTQEKSMKEKKILDWRNLVVGPF